MNVQLIVESEGAALRGSVRLAVCVIDMYRHRPIID